MIGRSNFQSGAIQSLTTFHFVAIPLLEGHEAIAFMVVPGDVDRMEQVLRAQRLDARRIELEMLEAPAHFIAGQSAMAELLLRDTDGLDIEDPVHDAEVMIDAADALLVLEIAFAGGVNGLDDFLQHRILRARRLGRNRDVTLGGFAGRESRPLPNSTRRFR